MDIANSLQPQLMVIPIPAQVMEQCKILGSKDICQRSSQFSGMDIKFLRCLNNRCNLRLCTKVGWDVEGLMDTMNNYFPSYSCFSLSILKLPNYCSYLLHF